MKNSFNENQKKAIEAKLGPVMVIAGAGSGKTRVLTSRFNYVHDHYGFRTDEILAITFTNKAANEMKERIYQNLKTKSLPWIGTFHSICLRILRQDIDTINRSTEFNVIDDEDQLAIIKEAYKKFNLETKEMPYKQIINLIDRIKINHLSINDIKDEQYWEYLNIKNLRDVINKTNVLNYYFDYCNRNNILDFNDLLILTNQVLQNPDVCNKWKNKFKYILVDEFQDTNEEQYQLLKHLVNDNQNLFVVGDPDQMIYSWRGASETIISDFKKDYPNYLMVILDINYRSNQEILDASNHLIKNNHKRIDKSLVAANGYAQKKPIYFHANNQDDESSWVVKKIQELLEQNINPEEIAILYRSNYLSRNIEQALIINGIRYKIFGGFKFYQRKEIKDLIAYIKAIFLADELSIKRIINTPRRGISSATIELIDKYAHENEISFANALFKSEQIEGLSTAARNGINEFKNLLASIELNKSMVNIFEQILENTKYIDYLKLNIEANKIPNIEELKNSIIKYEMDHPGNSFIDYLQDISLLSEQDDKNDDAISLMTVHVSKGLEFNYVFLIGLNEDIFPSKQSKSNEGIEEERRIAYVAITRARKQLFISSFGGINYMYNAPNQPSRFINEISQKMYDQDHTKVVSLTKQSDDWFDSQKNMSNQERNQKYETKNYEFKIGDQVVHTVFGLGFIIKIENQELTIYFNDIKQKKTIKSNHIALKRVIN